MYRIHNALTEIERKLEKIVNVKNFVFAFLFRNSEIKVENIKYMNITNLFLSFIKQAVGRLLFYISLIIF